MVRDGEEAELVERRLDGEELEVRDGVSVDDRADEDEDRADGQQRVDAEERQHDVRRRLQDGRDDEREEDRAELLAPQTPAVAPPLQEEQREAVGEEAV